MTQPQPVLSPLTAAAVFLVVTINPGGEDAVRDLLGDFAGLQRSVGFRIPEGRASLRGRSGIAGLGPAVRRAAAARAAPVHGADRQPSPGRGHAR